MEKTKFEKFFLINAFILLLCACSTTEKSDTDTSFDTADSGADDVDYIKEFDHVFPKDAVVKIKIDFDNINAYSEMVTKAKADPNDLPFYAAKFTFNDEEMDNVGVRLKGNSSLWFLEDNQLRSFKIHFEEYVDGQRFHHVDRLSLNNNFRDPSIMRERLAYSIALDFGLKAPRTAYAEVWVDGEFYGVYTLIQQVDKRFLKEHFGTENNADDGNLYKCYDGCPLEYWGDDPDLYRGYPPQDVPLHFCDPGVEDCGLLLKTNEDDPLKNDYSDLVGLIKTIDQVINDEISTSELEKIFDIEHFTKFMAWSLALSNLDSYFVSAHNFYIYNRGSDGRFMFIPWDLNEAYGIFACRNSQVRPPEVNIMEPCGEKKPLTTLINKIPEYKKLYCQALNDFLEKHYISSLEDTSIAAYDDLIATFRQEECVMDYPAGGQTEPYPSYSYDDFKEAQTHNPPTAPTPGVVLNLGFFNDLRIAELEKQIQATCE